MKKKEPIYFVTPNSNVEEEIIKALGFTHELFYGVLEEISHEINGTNILRLENDCERVSFYNSGLFEKL